MVFQNELMELIRYAPQTEPVHAVPLLASPPWINVLSSGGHIAGIVSPPGPRARYEVMTKESPPTPAEWRAAATATEGSRREDWAEWSSRRVGPPGAPPPMGGDRHPPLDDAPGACVRG